MATDDLVAWLREQLDEDERVARAATDVAPPPWQTGVGDDAWTRDRMLFSRNEPMWENEGSQGMSLTEGVAPHIARHDPARVLREVAAKRAIVDAHPNVNDGDCGTCVRGRWGLSDARR